jgi:hypothetical protein
LFTLVKETSTGWAIPSHPLNKSLTAADMSGIIYPDLKDRPVKETICLFDVDGTLTPARLAVSKEMLQTLSQLRQKCAIGFVSTGCWGEKGAHRTDLAFTYRLEGQTSRSKRNN